MDADPPSPTPIDSAGKIGYIEVNGDSPSSIQGMDDSIAKLRADALKQLADMDEDYERENKAMRDHFRMLELINQPDHNGKAEFEAKEAVEKRELQAMRDALMAAVDAMENDMRADRERYEQRVREEGEGRVLFLKNYNLENYYQGPQY